MARWVNVATVRWANTANDIRKGRERVREIWELLIDRAALDQPDILLLPEEFWISGLAEADLAEFVPGGPTVEWLARKARQYRTYVFAGIRRKDNNNRLYNSAVLLDRSGAVAGVYDKLFPTPGEMEGAGIVPGQEPRVFETDFGRIAAAICFDLNFRELFAAYRARKVDLCCFLSAMPGGTHLPIVARENRMYIASAAREVTSYIVNPLGRVLAETSGHAPCIAARLNLDVQLFHLTPDFTRQFTAIKKQYGSEVVVELASPEHWFMVRCDLPNKTAADIAGEFGLEPLDAYLDRTRRIRRQHLADPAGAWYGAAAPDSRQA